MRLSILFEDDDGNEMRHHQHAILIDTEWIVEGFQEQCEKTLIRGFHLT